MSRLEVPLTYRRLRSTGDVVVHAELALELKTDRGNWETVTFVIDPGTEMTTMPTADAQNRGLPLPKRPVSGLNFQGLEVRSGLLRARIPGMDSSEYVFPCYFLGDPNSTPLRPRSLLGLTGVIDRFDSSSTAHPRLSLRKAFSWSRRSNLQYRRWDLNPHLLARTGFLVRYVCHTRGIGNTLR
jgi:hypothetical protein